MRRPMRLGTSIFSSPTGCASSWRNNDSASSTSAIRRRQRAWNTSPSWVVETLRVERCSRRVPSRCSSSAMAADTVERGMPSWSAARVKLAHSTTRVKMRKRSIRSIVRWLWKVKSM
ncbi:hypothetical protein G6F32_015657 [Rhizopus arrhizus]|nr:hypothetical protein G6F32_015657 [Rhizopus arrhizus]